jgi:hypothetical protein
MMFGVDTEPEINDIPVLRHENKKRIDLNKEVAG